MFYYIITCSVNSLCIYWEKMLSPKHGFVIKAESPEHTLYFINDSLTLESKWSAVCYRVQWWWMRHVNYRNISNLSIRSTCQHILLFQFDALSSFTEIFPCGFTLLSLQTGIHLDRFLKYYFIMAPMIKRQTKKIIVLFGLSHWCGILSAKPCPHIWFCFVYSFSSWF